MKNTDSSFVGKILINTLHYPPDESKCSSHSPMNNLSQIVETESRVSIPVAVVLERKIDPSKKWAYPSWRLYAVVAGEKIQTVHQQVTIHDNGAIQRTFHGGLKVDLFKDGSEGYWYNLLSDDPYLFVVCDGEQGDMEITPVFVTANQDEATGHLESDDIVLSSSMPEEIRDLLERYVVNHYKPEIKKKRKRKDWLEDSLYAGGGNDKKS